MELQTLQEALKVEIQIHQVRLLLFRATGSVGQEERGGVGRGEVLTPTNRSVPRSDADQEVVSAQTKTCL